jgi:hypothetical protein
MADGTTAHVLTAAWEVCLNDGNETLIVFDMLEAARLFIKHIQSEDDPIEFYIYDSDYKFLEH